MSNSESILSRITLGLSISESPDIKTRGFSDVHFRDVFIEFSRYMLACGATLAYGGDFRANGFTEELFELKATYKGNANKIESYLGWPIRAGIEKLSDEDKLRYAESAVFHELPIPDGVDEKIPRNEFLVPDKTNPATMLIWARSMSQMRRECLAKRNNAQIMLGGRLNGYSSKYPGVVEEAYEVMKAGKPLFLIGVFGGATQAVIDAVSGETPDSLTEEGQYELWKKWEVETHEEAKKDTEVVPMQIKAAEEEIKQAEAELEQAQGAEEQYNAEEKKKAAAKKKADAEKKLASAQKCVETAKLEDYRGLVEHFNKHAPDSEERIDYKKLVGFFNEKGIAGLNNNLTDEENQRLFVTPHVAEMIALTLKGLVRIKK